MPNLGALFSSYRLNELDLPNRVVMAPMSRYASPGGVPTAEVAAYYRRRADNGVGLIITEGTGVGRAAALNDPNMPQFYGEATLAGWKKVVDEVHAAGGRIAPQLTHVGQKRSSTAPDWTPPAPYESPSGLSMTGEQVGQPMSEAPIVAISRPAGSNSHHRYARFRTQRLTPAYPCQGSRGLPERAKDGA